MASISSNRLRVLLLGTLALVAASPAAAIDYRWLINGSGASVYENADRWQNMSTGTTGTLPTSVDRIFFPDTGVIVDASSNRIVKETWLDPNVVASMRFGASTFRTEYLYTRDSAEFRWESGSFFNSICLLMHQTGVDGRLTIANAGTQASFDVIVTIEGSNSNAGHVNVLNGARLKSLDLAHLTNAPESEDTVHVSGLGSYFQVSRVTTTASTMKIRVSDHGLFEGPFPEQGNNPPIPWLHTLTLDNGVFMFRRFNTTNLVGYGVFGRLPGFTTVNNEAAFAPAGAVNTNINMNVGDLSSYVFSNAVPKFGGTISISGGALYSGHGVPADGNSVNGLELTGTGGISGDGTVHLYGGGLTGSKDTWLNPNGIGKKLTIYQDGDTTFNGYLFSTGSGQFQKMGAGNLTLAGERPNALGLAWISQGTLTLARTVPNALQGGGCRRWRHARNQHEQSNRAQLISRSFQQWYAAAQWDDRHDQQSVGKFRHGPPQ
jgi:hypothetical protein